MTPEGITAADVIVRFDLRPLPVEGGLFHRWYHSDEVLDPTALPERYDGDGRVHGTAIVAMVTDDRDSFSALHRLLTDELWHFYLGEPVVLVILEPDGTSRRVVLGHDIAAGQVPFALAPRGCWFGAHLLDGATGGAFGLFGCTMAPGFSTADFTGGDLAELLAGWPHEADAIRRLHRPDEPRHMLDRIDSD